MLKVLFIIILQYEMPAANYYLEYRTSPPPGRSIIVFRSKPCNSREDAETAVVAPRPGSSQLSSRRFAVYCRRFAETP